jgi:hypothetical protein
MRQELVEPGPRWEAALRYLGLPASTPVSAASLGDIVLALAERVEHLESQLAKVEAAHQPKPWTEE